MWQMLIRFSWFSLGGSQATRNRSPPVWLNPLNWESRCGLMKMCFCRGHPSFLKVFFNISNESHQTQLDQKEYKLIKTGGLTESVGWAHHNPTFYTPWSVSSSPFPPCPVSRWPQALAEMLKTNTSLEKLILEGNNIGDSGAQALSSTEILPNPQTRRGHQPRGLLTLPRWSFCYTPGLEGRGEDEEGSRWEFQDIRSLGSSWDLEVSLSVSRSKDRGLRS